MVTVEPLTAISPAGKDAVGAVKETPPFTEESSGALNVMMTGAFLSTFVLPEAGDIDITAGKTAFFDELPLQETAAKAASAARKRAGKRKFIDPPAEMIC